MKTEKLEPWKRKGGQIEYEDEDPMIRKMSEEEIAKKGIPSKMGQYFI